MKNISYLLVLLIGLLGCKKEEVAKAGFASITILNKSLHADIKIVHDGAAVRLTNKPYIASYVGERRIEVFDTQTNEKIIDTMLNVTGNQTYYVYQPFDISVPELITELPAIPPIDPRNPLKDVTAPEEGYMKLKVAFKTDFILPGKAVDLVLMSWTQEHYDVEVPIDTLHNVGADYGTQVFLVKRPAVFGVPVEYFKVAVIDRATGQELKDASGGTFIGRNGVNLPAGNNRFVVDVPDRRDLSSRWGTTSYPIEVDGVITGYTILPVLMWSL